MASRDEYSPGVWRAGLRYAPESRLVSAVRRGRNGAFDVLYERHASELLAYCTYLLGSRHDAEDALQATYAAAFRSILGDDRAIALRPWLFVIARNNCLDIMRRRVVH